MGDAPSPGDQELARRVYEDMVRRLAELDRADGLDLGPAPARRPRPARRRWSLHRRGRRQRVGPRDWRPTPPRNGPGPRSGVSFAVALLVTVGLVVGSGAWRDVLDFSGPDPAAVAASAGLPPLPADASDTRLLPQVPALGQGQFSLTHTTDDGRAVTYDPCRPLHYVVNPAGMPSQGLDLVRDAALSVSAATGLALLEEGATDEPPSTRREPLQPDRYGERWAPLLVAWSTAAEHAHLGGDIAGVGGSEAVAPSGPGSERLVTGQVVLDRDTFAEMLSWEDGYAHALAVVRHELTHVVGLGHVDDADELMHDRNTGQTGWGPGDLAGLALVGAGPCHRDT